MFIEHPATTEVVRLWRKWVGSALSLVLGVATGAAGLLAGAWTLTAMYRPAEARAAMAWVVARIDAPWAIPVQKFANDAVQSDALIFVGVIAAILCALGWSGLRTARRRFYGPSKLSDDGWGKIELETEPRVGELLKGRLILTKPGTLGEVFRLRLSCSERERMETTKTALLQQEEDTQLGGTGMELPFEFHIPPTARESGDTLDNRVIEWTLDVFSVETMNVSASTFELEVGPPTETVKRAVEAAETPQQKAEIAAIEKDLGVFSRFIRPYQRARLRDMTPAERAQLRDAVQQTGKSLSGAGRWVLGCFLVFMAVPVLVFLVAFLMQRLK